MAVWEDILSEADCRITVPRRAVMHVLTAAEVPLSPQEIHARGVEIHQRLGLVTVYRTLDLFEQMGLVRRVHLPENCHGYIATAPGHRHVLLCRECGRSIEFAGRDDLDVLIHQLEARTGFRVEDHILQLFGLCPECHGVAD